MNYTRSKEREEETKRGKERRREGEKKDRQTKAMQSSAVSSKNSGAFRRVVQFETIAHYTN